MQPEQGYAFRNRFSENFDEKYVFFSFEKISICLLCTIVIYLYIEYIELYIEFHLVIPGSVEVFSDDTLS